MYKRICILFALALLLPPYARGQLLLDSLSLHQDGWEVAAVSLHNYNPHPLQTELGTFVIRSPQALARMQQTWTGRPFYDDHCDYHYALKFYHNRKLHKTLLVNLNCNYITEGMFSYTFDPQLLLQLRPHFEQVPWSNITYGSIDRLRKAIHKLEKQDQFYFYHDVKPYQYDGCFVLKTEGHAPDVSRDSLVRLLADHIAWYTGSRDFYIVPHMLYLDAQDQLAYKYEIYCNEDLARTYLIKDSRNVVAWWRSHLDWINEENKALTLTVVGISKKRYQQVMGATN